MNKYGRIFIQYRYKTELGWEKDGNVGDCFQNFAVRNMYQRLGFDDKSLVKVNRDDIPKYDGEACRLIMQSWYADYMGVFQLPWSDKITPVFIGFHLNKVNGTRERFLREGIHHKMKEFEPIGCRDRNTRDFLIENGVKAYFSGCMTLTFDKREKEPVNGKVFIVDLKNKAKKRLPKHILQTADTSITHVFYWDHAPITEQDAWKFEIYSEEILNKYKNEAKLVITSRIHVAMPCIAMGIPVVFITDNPKDERFDVLRGIIPVYHYRDVKYIDWNPNAADISELKAAILDNAIAQLTFKNINQAMAHLDEVTSSLKDIVFLPWWVRVVRALLFKK